MREHCFICYLLTAFCLFLSSYTAIAKTIESVEYKYYEISPHTPHQIKPELMRTSPIRDNRGSFNGHTAWYINWNYQTSPGPAGCRLVNIETRVHLIHTLPALSQHVTDKQTIDIFNQFNAALTQHEKNHGKHGLQAAREMDKIFSGLQAQQNCHVLSRMVDNIGRSIVDKYTQKDIEYDRTTRNGETEGAVIY